MNHILDGITDGADVRQRFSHPHHHHMRQLIALRTQKPLCVQHLLNDLCCRQIANQPHARGRTKLTIERTPHLRRHTQRAALAVPHQNTFDEPFIGQLKQKLYRIR